jgi:hypothetical protein
MTLRESYPGGNATQGIQAETLRKLGTPDRRSSLTWIPPENDVKQHWRTRMHVCEF